MIGANIAEVEGSTTIMRRKKGEAEKSEIPCPNIVKVSYIL